MSCVLVAGVGPLPPQKPALQMAPGLRLWSLALAARSAGLEIVVASHDHFGHAGDDARDSKNSGCDGIRVVHWPQGRLGECLREELAEVRPAAVVATSDLVAAEVARQLPAEVPLWVDLYGDPIAEGQLLAALHAHDGGLAPLVANMVAPLARADHFSVCSRAQRLAMLGQLGLTGRLNAATCHRNLVSVIPGLLVAERRAAPQVSPLRGALVGESDFVVLWSGGFNTWTDIQTLFEGLSQAMEAEPRLHFVCLGGAIDRHSPGTHGEFEALVEQSPHRPRFHLLGWRPPTEVPGFCAGADVGLNIDAECHEAELGTRTRLLDWAQWEMAICSTPLSEVTQDLVAAGALQPFEPGNARSLAETLLHLARDAGRRRSLGDRAREYAAAHWTPEAAGEELRAWLRDPQPARDRLPGAAGRDTNRLLAWMRALEPALRSGETPPANLADALQRLRSLEGSRLVKLRDRLRGGSNR